MKPEHIGPTATLAAAIFSKIQEQHSQFTTEIVASAFQQAHDALLLGIKYVQDEEVKTKAYAAQSNRFR